MMLNRSGGRYINLTTTSFSEAIQYTQQAENLLLDIQSASGKTIIDQELPMVRSDQILITGVLLAAAMCCSVTYSGKRIIKR